MLGSFELEQAKMLAKRGNRVCYLSLGYFFRRKNTLNGKHETREWVEDNVHVLHRDWWIIPKRFPLIPSFVYYIYWTLFLNEACSRFGNPDIIHIHYPSLVTDADAVFRFAKNRCRIVCTEHYSKVLTKEIGRREQSRLKKYVCYSDSFICVGKPLKQSVEEITGVKNKVTVIPNIVNDCFFRDNIQHDGFVFVAVGRLVPFKQFDKIIESFKAAFVKDEGCRLIIVGDGPERQRLIEITNQDQRISFTGTLSRDDTAAVIASSDALICFSRLETFGVPPVEAMACGIPFIGTEALGFLEYLPDGCGIIIDSQDTEQLTKAMRIMYAKRDEYDSAFISRKARELFSEEAVMAGLYAVYNKVI